MALVGSAYITLRLVTDKIRDDIRKGIKDGSDPNGGWASDLKKNIDKGIKGLSAGNGLVWKAILGVASLGPAIQIIGAYLAQALSFVATLGPAMAAGAAVGVTAMLSLKQATGVLTLALKTQTPELARYTAATKGLKTELGAKLQNNILPALGGAQASILQQLTPQLVGTSKIIGDLINTGAKFAASPLVNGMIQKVLGTNNVVIKNLGSAIMPLIDIILRLLVAVGPVAKDFSAFALSMVKTVDGATKAGTASGKLFDFFQRGEAIAIKLGEIIWPVFVGLGNILHVAAGAGAPLLDTMSKLAYTFMNWTDSAGGQNTLKKYFDTARPIVAAVNGLIADVFRAFSKNLRYPGADNITKAVGSIKTAIDAFLPVVVSMLSNSGPGLAALFKQLGDILGKLASDGALGTFTATLGIMLNIVLQLLQLPFVGQLLSWAVAILGVLRALALVPGLINAIIFVIKILWTIITLNPWTLLLTIVIAALILMYMKVGWFRDFVNAAFAAIKNAVSSVFNWIKNNWMLILGILTFPIGGAVLIIIKYWSNIKDGFTSVKTWISTCIDAIVGFFRGLGGRIGGVVTTAFDGIKNAFKDAVNWIIDKWNGLQFSIPGVDTYIPGVGKIGGFTLGTPDIPRLAQGGTVYPVPGGVTALLAEAGRKERVEPLDADGLSKRDKAIVMALAGGSGGTPVVVHVYPSAGMNEEQLGHEAGQAIAKVLGVGR